MPTCDHHSKASLDPDTSLFSSFILLIVPKFPFSERFPLIISLFSDLSIGRQTTFDLVSLIYSQPSSGPAPGGLWAIFGDMDLVLVSSNGFEVLWYPSGGNFLVFHFSRLFFSSRGPTFWFDS